MHDEAPIDMHRRINQRTVPLVPEEPAQVEHPPREELQIEEEKRQVNDADLPNDRVDTDED